MQLQLHDQSAVNAAVRWGGPDPIGRQSARELIESPAKFNTLGTIQSRLAMPSLVSLLLAIGGVAGIGSQSSIPLYLFACSSAVAIAAVAVAVTWELKFGASKGGLYGLSRAELEQKIEVLEDLRWQAQDDADHLQALLDAQSAIILKRNAKGKITFTNRAFCTAFSVELSDVLSKPFHPTVIEHVDAAESPNLLAEKLPSWAQMSVQLVEIQGGSRWIEWTHRRLEDVSYGDGGIQTVGRDVTNQRRHEAALARARDQARAADRAKSRFLASMSHEIRTPMNGILGMSGLLGETEQSPEQRTYIQAVRKSAQTLLALIDEILDFSKIEAGHIELASDPVDIIDCVQGAVELLAARAYQKQLQLVWSTAPDMPRQFLGDEARLRQILLNLLSNAVKFTESGGISVWVGAESSDDQLDEIKIVVRDTGPGLSEDARARIFMEFERAVPDGSLQESGTGLGLAIAQRLAQSMGGGIKVTSVLGAGATFVLSVRLPRATQHEPKGPAERLRQRRVVVVSPEQIERRTIANFLRAHNMAVAEFVSLDEFAAGQINDTDKPPYIVLLDCTIDPKSARKVLDQLSEDTDIEAAVIAATGDRAEFDRFNKAGIENFLVRPIRPSTLLALLAGEVDKTVGAPLVSNKAVAASKDAVSWRVLVAEDNEINALLARTVLARLGCVPVMVANGREAIDEVSRSLAGKTPRLDAILMDLHMPQVDGLQATAEIHRLCHAAGQPRPAIVAVTANAFQEDRDKCIAAGMDDYLSKPFEPGDLRRILDSVAQRLAG